LNQSETQKHSLCPSELLAAAAAIAAGTRAYAAPVVFINPDEGEPGHFSWTKSLDELDPETWLDIMRPSTNQGGLVGPSSVGQRYSISYPDGFAFKRVFTSAGASVVTAPLGGTTQAFYVGAVIDGAAGSFASSASHILLDVNAIFDFYNNDFSANIRSYMGIRFMDVDGRHYGWIAVELARGAPPNTIGSFAAFAWGYETEPGVPIIAAIPAAGTLAALAFGAVLVGRGRKRERA
jgi:hypothetical protein